MKLVSFWEKKLHVCIIVQDETETASVKEVREGKPGVENSCVVAKLDIVW